MTRSVRAEAQALRVSTPQAQWPGAESAVVHSGLRAAEWKGLLDATVLGPFLARAEHHRWGLRVQVLRSGAYSGLLTPLPEQCKHSQT